MVAGVGEVSGGGFAADREVAAQGKHVFNAVGFHFVQTL